MFFLDLDLDQMKSSYGGVTIRLTLVGWIVKGG